MDWEWPENLEEKVTLLLPSLESLPVWAGKPRCLCGKHRVWASEVSPLNVVVRRGSVERVRFVCDCGRLEDGRHCPSCAGNPPFFDVLNRVPSKPRNTIQLDRFNQPICIPLAQ